MSPTTMARTRALASIVCIPLVLGGCTAALQALTTRPTVRVTDASLTNLTVSGVTIAIDVEVTNSLNVDVPLVGLDWALAAGGEAPFVRGATEPGGVLPASGRRTIQLPIAVAFPELLTAVRSVRPGETVAYAVDMGLRVDLPTGEARLPLRHSGSFPVPAPPSVRVASVSLDELSLMGARGTARVEVNNTNSFPLELSAFSYSLDLGRTRVAGGRSTSPRSFAPNDTRAIEIPLDVSLSGVGMSLYQALSNGTSPYRLNGALEVGTPFGEMELAFGSSGETEVVQ